MSHADGAVTQRPARLRTERSPDFAARGGVAVRPALLQRLGDVLKNHRTDELSAKLEAAGLPYAPIMRPERLLHDPHLKASGGLVPMQTDDGATTDVVLLPLLIGGRRPAVRRPLARIGEHTDEVLQQLQQRRTG